MKGILVLLQAACQETVSYWSTERLLSPMQPNVTEPPPISWPRLTI